MTEAFHIAALALGAFNAAIWSSEGWHNILLKAACTGFAAWAAVVVAKDFLA